MILNHKFLIYGGFERKKEREKERKKEGSIGIMERKEEERKTKKKEKIRTI